MNGALVVFLVFLPIPIFCAVAQDWWWFWTSIGMGVVIGVMELISVAVRGYTLSEGFRKAEQKTKVFVTLGITMFYLFLLGHLWLGWGG